MWEFVDMPGTVGMLLYAPNTSRPKSFSEMQKRADEAVNYYIERNIEWFVMECKKKKSM